MTEEIEGVDYVVCQICGGHFKQITQPHLNKHDITFDEYIKRYPHVQTISDKFRNTRSKQNSGENNPFYGKTHTVESKKLIKDNHSTLCGLDHPLYGVPKSEEHKQKISDNHADVSGDKHPTWKGGISSERNLFISSDEYAQYRTEIFIRDNYTCQECGHYGGDLNCHHILPYRDYPDPQFSLNPKNGITLCVKCHRKTFGKEYEFWCRYFDIVNGIRQL